MVNTEIFIALGVCVAVTGVIYILQFKKKQQQQRKKEEDENKESDKPESKIEELKPQINNNNNTEHVDKSNEESEPKLNIEEIINNNNNDEHKPKDDDSQRPNLPEILVNKEDIVKPVIVEKPKDEKPPVIEIIKPNIEDDKHEELINNVIVKPIVEEVKNNEEKKSEKPHFVDIVQVLVPPVVNDNLVASNVHEEKDNNTQTVPLIPLIPATIIQKENESKDDKTDAGKNDINTFVTPILPPIITQQPDAVIEENKNEPVSKPDIKVEEKNNDTILIPILPLKPVVDGVETKPVNGITEEKEEKKPDPVTQSDVKDEEKNKNTILAPILPINPVVDAVETKPVNGITEEKKPEQVEKDEEKNNETILAPILPIKPVVEVIETKPVTDNIDGKKEEIKEQPAEPISVSNEKPENNNEKKDENAAAPNPVVLEEEPKPLNTETNKVESPVVKPEISNNTDNSNTVVEPLLPPVKEDEPKPTEEPKNEEKPSVQPFELLVPTQPPPPVPIVNNVQNGEPQVNGHHLKDETLQVDKHEEPINKPDTQKSNEHKKEEESDKIPKPAYETLKDSGYGKIDVTIFYDEKKSRFSVNVHSAQNLRNVEKNGLSDPYARITLQPDPKEATKKKTRVIKDSLNPTWNEELIWTMTKAETESKTLVLIVKDEKSFFTKQDTVFLGKLSIELKNADIYKEPLRRWFWLQPEYELSSLLKEKL